MSAAVRSGKTLLFLALRLVFRLVPMSEASRDRARQLFLARYSQLVPTGPSGQVLASVERRARFRADAPSLDHVPYLRDSLPSPLPATLVAFFLPQFHPIAENDQWWGKGFTEWRNVVRALPQFEGHVQPRLPADLGFYDLRNVDTMCEQVRLAQEYGIGAFCFYFYWFSGQTLLEQPVRQWLEDSTLDLPFCLCWANENWSRRWDGRNADILIAQRHSPEDDLAFIAYIAPYLRDTRYLRIEGKPLLLVYRPDLLPEAEDTAARWRLWCRENGIGEIHLAYVQSFERPDPRDIGFDAAVEFPPNLSSPRNLTADQNLLNPGFEGNVLDWRELAADYSARPMPEYPLYPGVNTGWDNEPRRTGKGRIYQHASPRRYRDWLRSTIVSRMRGIQGDARLVFINAWNEWAEGAVLEPDTALGHAWLHATRQALQRSAVSDGSHVRMQQPCVVIHAWYADIFDEILGALQLTGFDWRVVVTTTPEKEKAIRDCLSRRNMHAEIEVAENHGRDILPFLKIASRLLDQGVGVVLKLHTKGSLHRADGDEWRRQLVHRLASPDRATLIRRAFDEDETLGIVGPEAHLLQLEKFWGANIEAVRYVSTRVGMRVPGEHELFVAGSMFWVRLESLRLLLDAGFFVGEFETESGQLDGTLPHAVERLFAACATQSGFTVHDAASIAGVEPEGSAGVHPGEPH
ncbi:MAG: glycoside hydrolase family 99-like domain-containing protein [Lysobacter sp.]|nr:glycoside hydrolase family 99-like domain-containing protein [Lysobacter sp.]